MAATLRILFPTVLTLSMFWAMSSAQSQDRPYAALRPVTTSIEGRILYVDANKKAQDYPFSEEVVKTSTNAHLFPINGDRNPIIHPIVFDEITDKVLGKIITYSARNIGHYNVEFRADFSFDVYRGTSRNVRIHTNLGTVKAIDIEIKKIYDNENKAYEFVKYVIYSNNIPKEDLNDALHYLLVSQKNKILNPSNYFDAILVTKNYIDIYGYTDYSQIRLWYEVIDFDDSFFKLDDYSRFRILRELGIIFSRAPHPLYEIEPTLTHAAVAHRFFEKAISIYEGQQSISFKDFVRAVQEKYQSECGLEIYDDCFETIENFLVAHEEASSRVRNSFLAEYVSALEKISKYGPENGGSDLTEENFIMRMISDESNLRHWLDFHCMFKKNYHLSDVSRFDGFVKKARWRSEVIADRVECPC